MNLNTTVTVRKEFHLSVSEEFIPSNSILQTDREPFRFIGTTKYNGDHINRQFCLQLRVEERYSEALLADPSQSIKLASRNPFIFNVETKKWIMNVSIKEGYFNMKKISQIAALIALFEFNSAQNQWIEIATTAQFLIVSKNRRTNTNVEDLDVTIELQSAVMHQEWRINTNLMTEPIGDVLFGDYRSESSNSGGGGGAINNSMEPMEGSMYDILSYRNAEVLGNFRALNFYKTSDAKVKTNVKLLKESYDPREILFFIDGVQYEFDAKRYPQLKSQSFVGFLAQQVQQQIPNAVSCIDGVLHVDYTALIPFIVEAVKHNSNDVKSMQNRIVEMDEEYSQVEKLLLPLLDDYFKEFKLHTNTLERSFSKWSSIRYKWIVRGMLTLAAAIMLVIGILLIDIREQRAVVATMPLTDLTNATIPACPSACNIVAHNLTTKWNYDSLYASLAGSYDICNSLGYLFKHANEFSNVVAMYLKPIFIEDPWFDLTLFYAYDGLLNTTCPTVNTVASKTVIITDALGKIEFELFPGVPIFVAAADSVLALSNTHDFEPTRTTILIRPQLMHTSLPCIANVVLTNVCK